MKIVPIKCITNLTIGYAHFSINHASKITERKKESKKINKEQQRVYITITKEKRRGVYLQFWLATN